MTVPEENAAYWRLRAEVLAECGEKLVAFHARTFARYWTRYAERGRRPQRLRCFFALADITSGPIRFVEDAEAVAVR